jgi:hypothetical protein
MTKFQATVTTSNASRYLQQLCKHWSHRFQVEFNESRGTVRMNEANCSFQAEPQRLLMTLDGGDPEALPRLCEVVAEHLKRFAFREEIDVRWSETETQ